jgi:hypothetical protein
MRTAILLALLFVTASASGQTRRGVTIPADFVSDGCSMFPDGDYCDCCVEHDKEYFIGGSLKERREADKRLYRCIRSKGGAKHKFVAAVMYLGVRIGGVSFLPTPFRWGFGNRFPRKEPEQPEQNKKEPQ